MTDIIANAQKLLDGATPGPWELINGEIHQIQHTPEQCTSIRCDHRWPVLSESWGENPGVAAEDGDLALMAASRENAEALAEESYEFIVQVKRANTWQFYIGESHMVSDNPGAAYGFSLRSNALEFSKMETKRPTRIVRRRVSPVEVME